VNSIVPGNTKTASGFLSFKPFAYQITYGLREDSDCLQDEDQQGGA
jgi:hypothetical protein